MAEILSSNSKNLLAFETFDENILDKGISTSLYSFNGHSHEIQIFITNGNQIYSIAPTAIVHLSIEETIADWVTQGSLIIYNSNELMEYLRQYNFGNDGEDLLRIRILPLDLPIKGLPELDTEVNRNLWEINQLFSIYNIEDVSPESSGGTTAKTLKKFKKFYFWDIRYQIMLTKNIEYSTALSPNAPITLNNSLPLTDDNRSIPTGIAIDEIIKTSLNNSFLAQTGLDFKTDPEKYWDIGGRNIFYTSGATNNCSEDLNYIKSRHISSVLFDNKTPDFCLLNTERSNGGLPFFTLRPLSKIFKNAGSGSYEPGEDQIEHFYLQADTKQTTGITEYRAPIKKNFSDNTRDITLRDYSHITSYEFVDIPPIINAGDFISYSVNSFDFLNRRFNVEFTNHNYQTAQNIFKEKYISQLFTNKKSGGNNFLLNTANKSKQDKYSVIPVFNNEGDSTKPEIRAISGLYQLLYTGLFQNTCINFTVPGLTLRQAGKFIGIDRPEGSEENILDDKLCGQWYVINVMHTISNGAYYNNITAVKIHRYKSTTSEQRATERAINQFAGPEQTLQDVLYTGSNSLRR